jgi:hypothetical protein
VTFRQRRQVLRGGAERHRDAFFFFEVETSHAEIGIELGDDAGAAAGHEVGLAFVVLQRELDPFRFLDRITGRIGEAGEIEHSLKALAAADRPAQRLFDLRTERRRMFGKARQLLQHLKALRPECVAEQAKECVGLRALLRLAKGARGPEKCIDVGRITLHAAHPERFQIVELLFFNQRVRIFGEPQQRTSRRVVERHSMRNEKAGRESPAFPHPSSRSR